MPIKKIKIGKTVFVSIASALRFYKNSKYTYDQRVRRGWNNVEAITIPKLIKGTKRTDGLKITIDKKTYPSNAAAALSLGISYSAFMSRKYRGKNRNEIKLKGTIPRKSRSKIQILNDTIADLKAYAKKNSINKTTDWYKVKLDDVANIIAYYNKKIQTKKISAYKFLCEYYPKKKFLPWLFSGKGLKMPDKTWDQKKNRILYIRWLVKKLGFKKKVEYYGLKENHFSKNYGANLLHSNSKVGRKKFDIIDLLEETYPNYEWQFWKFSKISNNFITEKQKKNLSEKELKVLKLKIKKRHKLVFKWILKQEKIPQSSNKIYDLSNSIVKKYKGARSLLKTYKNFPDLVISLLDVKIDRFKFKHNGRGFWEDKKNHTEAIQYLAKELGIKKCNDWYTVQYDDFDKIGIGRMPSLREYKGSFAKCIIKNIPKCKLVESKFDRSSKYEYRARRFAICIYGEKNVKHNFYPKFLNGLELDIFVPNNKMAIEYNGSQHYFFNKHYHKNNKVFLDSKLRDKKKLVLCKKNNINLIVIKYDSWDGFPKSFLKIIEKHHKLRKFEKDNFWKRFKNEDIYKDINNEIKKTKRIFK
jgi:hypothetical protein